MLDVYSRVRYVRRDDVEIVVTDHGSEDGTPVLLIHGFPDSARLWRHQIPVLVDAGYRALAPDLRGFGRSEKPEEVDAYAISELGSDMIAVLDDAGIDKTYVVGHDWRAAVGWYLAINSPERVRSLVVLSVGHPGAFRNAGYLQLEKSWYMLLFQFEGIAETWLSDDNWRRLRSWTGGTGEVEHWIHDLSRPGALTAALKIYRANSHPKSLIRPPRDWPSVQVGVMGVWSSDDVALLEKQMKGSAEYVADDWRYERIDGMSHWIPVEAPDRLNGLLLDWFAQH
ncbi:MAG TPA: alpha/beta fold hydrolase [Acidimicrobiia bacterium]|nr:alpha/beta fold hydrolase [Acidimicrobiia bacterium]